MSQNHDFEEYFSLIDERDKLGDMLGGATNVLRPVIEQAVETANTRIAGFEQDPDIQRKIRTYGRQIMQSLEEIDQLSTAVDLGLVDKDVIEQQKAGILSSERNRHILNLYRRFDLIEQEASVVEVSPQASEAISGKETDQQYPAIEITIQEDGVKLGKTGKYIALSKAYAKNQRDYSEERKAVLKVLVEHAGEEVIVSDLWKEAFGDKEFERDEMSQIRGWLNQLTFRRQQIVQHNGKRGLGSAYVISNPNVTIKEVIKTTSTKRGQPQTEELTTDAGDISVTKAKEAGKRFGAEKTIEAKVDQPVISFPLNHAESLLLAEYLELRSDILRTFEIPVMDNDTVLKGLRDGFKQTNMMVELSPYGGDINTARKAVIDKVCRYFSDADIVMDDIDNMPEKDNRFQLFQYLLEFEEDQRKFLLDKLAESTPRTVITEKMGSFTSGVQVDSIQSYHQLSDGTVLEKIEEGQRLAAIPDEATPLVLDPQNESTGEQPEVPVAIENVVPESIADAIEQPDQELHDVRITGNEKAQFDDILDERIKEVLDLANKYNMVGKGSRSLQGVEGMSFMTSSFVKNAVENGIISRDSKTLTKEDIVTLVLLKEFGNVFSVKKSSQRPDRRQITAAIKRNLK